MLELLIKSKQKEKWFKKNGYKRCPVCGNYYLLLLKICTLCEIKNREKKKQALILRLRMNSSLSYEEAFEKNNTLTLKEYTDIKLRELNRLEREIKFLIEKNKLDEALDLSKKYIQLETLNLDDKQISREAKVYLDLKKEKNK